MTTALDSDDNDGNDDDGDGGENKNERFHGRYILHHENRNDNIHGLMFVTTGLINIILIWNTNRLSFMMHTSCTTATRTDLRKDDAPSLPGLISEKISPFQILVFPFVTHKASICFMVKPIDRYLPDYVTIQSDSWRKMFPEDYPLVRLN